MKGQQSAEFFVVIAVIMFIFLVFLVIYQGQNVNLLQSQDSVSAMERAYSLASAINYVYLAGDGASYNFTFRKYSNENVSISGRAVQCSKNYVVAQAPLLTDQVNATIVGGGEMLIKNNEGVIEIE